MTTYDRLDLTKYLFTFAFSGFLIVVFPKFCTISALEGI